MSAAHDNSPSEQRSKTAPEPGKYISSEQRLRDLGFVFTDFSYLTNPHPEKIRLLETGLRDADQAKKDPMTYEQRLDYFAGLLRMGFVEIEVGIPSSNDLNRRFVRTLIEDKLIPDGVLPQVLVAGDGVLIEKTFEALKDAPPTIVHVYIPTSESQVNVVFKRTRQQVIDNAVESTRLVRQLAIKNNLNIIYQFSPESFTETDPKFALAVCNAVVDAWDPKGDEKVILNLPATVEVCEPHIYGSLIQYIRNNLKRRDQVVISIHPHNDMGMGVAAATAALRAGAERVEGVIGGGGERAGNLDLLVLSANRLRQGLDPMIDLRNGNEIRALIEDNLEPLPERHPVFSPKAWVAYSGTHQNAIDKYLTWYRDTDQKTWTGFPYLLGDPHDFGFTFDDLIEVNQYSGKNGVNNRLRESLFYRLPPDMLVEFTKAVKDWCVQTGGNASTETISRLLGTNYINPHGPLELKGHFKSHIGNDMVKVHLELVINGGRRITETGIGRGAIDATVKALKEIGQEVEVEDESTHSRGTGSEAEAVAFIKVSRGGRKSFGMGIDRDIETANIKAVIAGANRLSSMA